MDKRPSGVTFLGASTVVAAILMIINGSLMASVPAQKVSQHEFLGMQLHLPSTLAYSLIYGTGVVMFTLGVASFLVAWGLLKGYPWARFCMIAFTSIGIAIFVAVAAMWNFWEVANLAVNASILSYLFKPNVRSYFKGASHATTEAAA